ncbi:hypothetical protein EVAR_53753_1 [Eumeta japonica]|uniref:Uncharacterized protein n=1 Tax=Eumeta variegata TaxID=151549 RepID=A0A4C1ZCI6_EUMVA|nr:hypothetical protein EVAR_53753_1 [Eumeta japonica]
MNNALPILPYTASIHCEVLCGWTLTSRGRFDDEPRVDVGPLVAGAGAGARDKAAYRCRADCSSGGVRQYAHESNNNFVCPTMAA